MVVAFDPAFPTALDILKSIATSPVMKEGASSVSAIIATEMDGWRLDRALAALIPTLSRERLKSLISSGQVSLAGTLSRDPSAKAKLGNDYQVIIPAPTPAHNEAQDIALNIVFEDDHLLVLDKQAGLVVHPAAGNFDGTLVNALLHHCAGRLSGIGGVARPGIVHRIDKDTSGLMVVAKTDRAHEGLAAQFMDHSIIRRYQAITSGRPIRDAGTVDAPLARSTANRKKIAIVEEGRGKRAVTHWQVVKPLKSAALIECRLETGRTHQIRVHMSSIGHPLLGDPVYGRISQSHRETLARIDFHRQALHAAVIGFIHPIDRKNLSFESKMPDDMQRLFSELSV
jgi:23S rRNA pseudouridine1911/1915/1917 synthase